MSGTKKHGGGGGGGGGDSDLVALRKYKPKWHNPRAGPRPRRRSRRPPPPQ